MDVMMEETFGPVVGIMKVENDEEAMALMNDSPYGLVGFHPIPSRRQFRPGMRPSDELRATNYIGC